MNDPKKELRAFVLRYHGQQAIKGLVMFLTLGISVWLLFAVIGFLDIENTMLRTALFFSYVAIFLGLSIKYWIPGVLALFGLKFRLSDKEAALLLKKWMPGVEDKVVNFLELEESEYRYISPALWKRGLELRKREVGDFPIKGASPWREIKPTFKWLLLPICLVMLFVVLGKWSWVERGSDAVWAFQREIREEAAFRFILPQEILRVEKGGSLRINVSTEGLIEPDVVYAEFGGSKHKLRRETDGWALSLMNITNSGGIIFEGGGVVSGVVAIEVVDIARLVDVELIVDYPIYLSRPSEKLDWSNRLIVPRGTRIEVRANKEAVNDWRANFGQEAIASGENGFSFTAQRTGAVEIELLNGLNSWVSWGLLEVEVVMDEMPQIDAEYFVSDSIIRADILAEDDFGIRSLSWVLYNEDGQLAATMLVGRADRSVSLSHTVNVKELIGRFPNANAWAYMVEDNDLPNGYKSSTSKRYVLISRSEEERMEELRRETSSLSSGASNSEKKLQEQKKLLEQLAAESRGAKMNFTERNKLESQIESLINNAKSRELRLERLEEAIKDINTESKSQDKEEILKRVEEAKEQLKKADLDKLEELLNREKKVELLKLLQESQKKEKEAVFSEQQLAELLKRLDVELQFERSFEQLKGLEEKQQELSERKDDSPLEQEKLNEEIEEWNREYEELLESNEALKEDFEIEGKKEEREDILKQAAEAAKASKSGNAESEQKEQKESADKLREMLDALSGMSDAMGSEQHEENIERLRQIQDNLIVYSQREEEVGTQLKEMDPKDPSIVILMQEQQELQQGAVIIQDSLRALALRVPMIGKTIFDALSRMDVGAVSAKSALAEREVDKAQVETRYSMMAANELALLLDEVSKKMQAQLKGMKAGKSSCNKPGGSKPSAEGAKQAQKKLMKEMGEKLGEGKKSEKKGEKGDGGKKGSGAKEGKGLSGKEFSDLLQKQEALRQMLQDMLEEDGALGAGGNGEDLLDLMEESEKELAEMVLNEASLKRQEEIESRLLEADEAQRERGEEERRESKSLERTMDYIGSWGMKEGVSKKEIERIKQDPILYKKFYKERLMNVPNK